MNNYPAIVREVHNEFSTEGERLLQEAKRILARPHLELTLKAERVNKLGFTSSKAARIGQNVVDDYKKAHDFIQDYVYFAQHYPFNKFITEDGVKRICEKYGLVFGDAARYTGSIPEKNLQEIECFTLREKDYTQEEFKWFETRRRFRSFSDFEVNSLFYSHTHEPVEPSEKAEPKRTKAPFKIVAPLKDFDQANTTLKGHKLEVNIPDPIVLQPVKGGYLIVTAWGDEAADEMVVNSINN